MDIEAIRQLCLSKAGTTESFPFNEDTLVFKVGGKIFALAFLEKSPCIINIKTKPEVSENLREAYPAITGAYHMNKKHWNSLECENLPSELVCELVEQSYQLVFQSLTKKQQAEILSYDDR